MTTKLLYKYINAETIEDDFKKVCSGPENWVVGGKLYWPPPKDLNSKRKKQSPPEVGWKVYDCKVLGEPFTTLKEALAKEKFYEQFSNSESEKEHLKRKQLKRKHPVTVDLIDANQLFDKVQVQATGTRSQPDVKISLDPILPAELLDGQYMDEDTNLSVIAEALGSTVSSKECSVQSKDVGFSQDPLFNHPAQAMDYQTQLNTVQPCQYSGQPSLSYVQPSENNGQPSQNIGQPTQYRQPSQYNVSFKQHLTQTSEDIAYANQQSSQSNQFPVQGYQYHIESKDVAVHSNRIQNDRGNVIVLEQYSLGSNEYSRPMKNTSDSVQAIKNKQERIGKKKTIQINKGKINKNGKENTFEAKATKTVNAKIKSEKLKSGRPCLKKKNVVESNQSSSTSKYSIKSFREIEKIKSQPSTSSVDEYASNYVPSFDDHTMPDNLNQACLPLIYKELLEIKSLCKSNQVENNRNLEEVKKICEKLASTIEEDDPFAGESVETFNAQFPIKKRSNLKSFYQEMIDDCSIKKKLAFRFRECMKYFICDSLLKRYTWKGTTKKPGFIKLTRIWKTLYSSVTKVFRKYTESKFSQYMSDYTKQATNRYKRKLKRQNGEHETDGADTDDNNENEEEEDEKCSGGDDNDEEGDEDFDNDSDDDGDYDDGDYDDGDYDDE